ncbi:MAG TPA: GNAT family N-acetyltransferase [Alteraurantiacibacter sp.]|jgi:GNAT superfamily N-acetyltransferase
MKIRGAQAGDLELLVPLFDAYRQFYGQQSDIPGAREFLSQRLERRDSLILIAVEEAEAGELEFAKDPAGFAQMFTSFSSTAMASVVVLNDLFVAPEWRGNGIGKTLVEGAENVARRAGAAGLTLATQVRNKPAQNLYEKMGWVAETEFRTYKRAL